MGATVEEKRMEGKTPSLPIRILRPLEIGPVSDLSLAHGVLFMILWSGMYYRSTLSFLLDNSLLSSVMIRHYI